MVDQWENEGGLHPMVWVSGLSPYWLKREAILARYVSEQHELYAMMFGEKGMAELIAEERDE